MPVLRMSTTFALIRSEEAEMTVKQVIQGKGAFVATIRPEATLTELVETLAEHRIGAMVVSIDGTHIEGIVSERDIVRALRSPAHAIDLDGVLVQEIMTRR